MRRSWFEEVCKALYAMNLILQCGNYIKFIYYYLENASKSPVISVFIFEYQCLNILIMCVCFTAHRAFTILCLEISLFKLIKVSLESFIILFLKTEKKCSTGAYWGVYGGRNITSSMFSSSHFIEFLGFMDCCIIHNKDQPSIFIKFLCFNKLY